MRALHVVAPSTLQNGTGTRGTGLALLADDRLCLSFFFSISPFMCGTIHGWQVGVTMRETVFMSALLTDDLWRLRSTDLCMFALRASSMISINLVKFEAGIFCPRNLVHQGEDVGFSDGHSTESPFLLVVEACWIDLPIANRRNEVIRQTLPTVRVIAG